MSVPNTYSTQIQFGAGYIYGLNQGSTLGAAPPLIIPGQFPTIQDASVDLTFTVKELNGQLEFPVDLASASKKISGKIMTGRIDLNLLNQLVFADDFVTGSNAIANVEPHTIASSPTDTVQVINNTTFVQDLGVWYSSQFDNNNQVQLVPVPTSPAQGQYTVDPSTGTYTFNGADAGAGVLISYQYTVLTGHALTVTNRIMGYSRPVFAAYFSEPYQGNNDLILYYCRATSLKMPEKREDYLILEIDFMAAAAPNGDVLTWSMSV